ncbi:MAG: hypothetical protein V3T70_01655 [Phycisphaerae bacterium]
MRRKRSRIRLACKILGICATVLVIAAWAISVLYPCGSIGLNGSIGLENSAVLFSKQLVYGKFEWDERRVRFWTGHLALDPLDGFRLELPRIRRRSAFTVPTGQPPLAETLEIVLPLWIPLITFGIPTALMIIRDRRRRIPPGHCRRCGYDLTGNVSGVCPECGTACASRDAGAR